MEEEFKNMDETPNNIGAVDDIGIEMLKEQLVSLEKEEETYRENIESAMKVYDNYKKQWDIDEELFKLELENFGIKEEAKKNLVHFIPRFWELQKIKFEYKIRQETFTANQYLDTQTDLIEEANNQLKIVLEQKAKVQAQLDEVAK